MICFLLDALEEKHSRKKWRGLLHSKYITHLISNTLHYCAITIILFPKFILLDEYPKYLSIIALALTGGGIIIVIQHIWRLYIFKHYVKG